MFSKAAMMKAARPSTGGMIWPAALEPFPIAPAIGAL